MLVQLPLHLDLLPGTAQRAGLARRAGQALRGQRVGNGRAANAADLKLDAVALADTNAMELRVFANDEARTTAFITQCWSHAWTTWAKAPAARPYKT